MADSDLVSSYRHLGRALRIIGGCVTEGRVEVTPRAWDLAQRLIHELVPAPPADPPTPPPSGAA